jgi:hypothetical protein
MFVRLWWKEARQTWPSWGLLAVAGLAVQSYLFCYWSAEVSPGGYGYVALVTTMMYLFLIAAAVFAGERESGTLWILDAMPAERLRVWSAKASFALATTLALGALLWLFAAAFGRDLSVWLSAGATTLVWGVTALGWGLLWSAVLSNALQAAVVAMASLALTLLFLVNLQHGLVLEAAPVLLTLAALTTGASAWAFRAGGPPKRAPRRARPAAQATVAAVPAPGEPATIRWPGRIWTAAVPRLLWETLRQVRAELWMLVGLAVAGAVAPYLIVWDYRTWADDHRLGGVGVEAAPMFTLIGAAFVALAAGVLVFNGENRGRTHRFLLHHGARPGVVWAVKVATWWAASLGLWSIAVTPVWLMLAANSRRWHPMVTASGSLISCVVSGPTILFAIAVVCGMVFRRGIVAGLIAFLATLAVVIPMVALGAAQVMLPWDWPYVAVGFLGVSWAWSGDWLYDAPGWRRWARLVLYAAGAPAVLVPFYIAGRVWGVPGLPPEQSEALFQRSRVVAPVAEEANAAPLYMEAYRLISRNAYPTREPVAGEAPASGEAGMAAEGAAPTPGPDVDRAPDWAPVLSLLDEESFDPPPATVTAWLKQLEPALAKLREGARRPSCRYMDLRTATEFDPINEPPIDILIRPLAVSARVQLARGDLDGAWVEVETIARLARQLSYTSLRSGQVADSVADGLVLRWAADPRQTVATLEKAARAWKVISPGASPAEQIRVDAALFHNALDLPRETLIDKLLFGQAGLKRKVSATEKLRYDVQTTPWEVARARKVFDLLAAAQIQRFETDAYPVVPHWQGIPAAPWPRFNSMVDPNRSFRVQVDGRTVLLSHDDLIALTFTTPLLEYTSVGQNPMQLGWDQEMQLGRAPAMQRAIWLTLLLRRYQARHDGKLPESLDGILVRPGEDSNLAATSEDLADPYSGKPFGYVASHGQMLLPIGATEALTSASAVRSDPRQKPAKGCRLLYSVGPDGVDDRAERNVGIDQKGDFVFPLKDDVKPPGIERH